MVVLEYNCSVQQEWPPNHDIQDGPHDVLAVERVLPKPMVPQSITVALQRTVRVPDGPDGPDGTDAGHPSALPPGLGYFPIYKTQEYASRLPPDVALNGGVFVPMYQREAMWLRFHATAPFMVKVYVGGGVNAISGEYACECAGDGTRVRREAARRAGASVQDYAVVPGQLWLDGVAAEAGAVRQFVAVPVGRGYTVEAQMTGGEGGNGNGKGWQSGSMQVEITPARNRPVPGSFEVFISTDPGFNTSMFCGLRTTVGDVKNFVWERAGVAPGEQRLVCNGRQLIDDGMTLWQCGIQNASTIYLLSRLLGGAPDHQNHRLGIAAGGRIRQEIFADIYDTDGWLRELTFTFPIHILNSDAFRAVTGINPPPTPISAETYACAGLPFFNFYGEEASGISGCESFRALKSVGQIDMERGLADGEEEDEEEEDTGMMSPVRSQNVVDIYPMRHPSLLVHEHDGDLYAVGNPDGLIRPAGPYRAVRSVADLEKEMNDLSIAASTNGLLRTKGKTFS